MKVSKNVLKRGVATYLLETCNLPFISKQNWISTTKVLATCFHRTNSLVDDLASVQKNLKVSTVSRTAHPVAVGQSPRPKQPVQAEPHVQETSGPSLPRKWARWRWNNWAEGILQGLPHFLEKTVEIQEVVRLRNWETCCLTCWVEAKLFPTTLIKNTNPKFRRESKSTRHRIVSYRPISNWEVMNEKLWKSESRFFNLGSAQQCKQIEAGPQVSESLSPSQHQTVKLGNGQFAPQLH